MTKSRQIIFLLLFTTFGFSYGQKTPQELGKIVFDVLKNKKIDALDTLTPKPKDIVEILTKKYPTAKVNYNDRFLEKYEYHDKRFKKICWEIRNDTSEIKINWEKSVLTKVDFFEKPYPYQDTTKTSKPILVNYLDLYITSDTSTLILEFKEIYFHNGLWKLSEHIRGKKPDRSK